MKVLLYKGEVAGETRPLYCLKAWGREVVPARILSVGKCNFSCPYCKRGGHFRAPDGSIIHAVEVPEEEVEKVLREAKSRGEVVRLSGGDPVMYAGLALKWAEQGLVDSVAHNGSNPRWAVEMAQRGVWLFAIDVKGTPELYPVRAGVHERFFYRAVETVNSLLALNRVYVDLRIPVFGDTTLDELQFILRHVDAHSPNLFVTLRGYSPVKGADFTPPTKDQLLYFAQRLKKELPWLKLGVRAKWEPSGFIYFL